MGRSLEDLPSIEIPAIAELARDARWMLFDKARKPLQPSGDYGKSNDPTTWSSFEVVCGAFLLREDLPFEGVSYVCDIPATKVDASRERITLVDFDNCIDSDDKITNPWVAQAVAFIDSYTEYSPSGKGLHIYVRGRVETGINAGYIELYSFGRHFSVTGRHFAGTPLDIRSRPDQIAEICRVVKVEMDARRSSSRSASPNVSVPANDSIPKGQRNAALVKEASRLLREEHLRGQNLNDAMQAFNARRCDPPSPYDEVLKISRWMDLSEQERLRKLFPTIPNLPPGASLTPSPNGSKNNDPFLRASQLTKQANAQPAGISGAEVRPNLISLAEVEVESIDWLWPGYIPKGKITDVIGDGDLGKSLVMLDITARMTSGRPMPDDPKGAVRAPINVVLLVAEDDLADTVVPRLIAAGADMSKIKALEGPFEGVEQPIIFPDHMPAVEAAVRQQRAELLIIDPVMAFLSGNIKSGIDSEVRQSLMNPLKSIASRFNCAVLSLRHTNKNEGASASMRGGGSVAFRNASRAGLAFGPDPDDESGDRRIMAQSKKNLGKKRPALAYEVESTRGRVPKEGAEGTPVIKWLGVAEGATAASILGTASKTSGPRTGTKVDEATTYIRTRLSGGTAVSAAIMQKELEDGGFSKSTVQRAKDYACVKSERMSTGQKGEGEWTWQIAVVQPTEGFLNLQSK